MEPPNLPDPTCNDWDPVPRLPAPIPRPLQASRLRPRLPPPPMASPPASLPPCRDGPGTQDLRATAAHRRASGAAPEAWPQREAGGSRPRRASVATAEAAVGVGGEVIAAAPAGVGVGGGAGWSGQPGRRSRGVGSSKIGVPSPTPIPSNFRAVAASYAVQVSCISPFSLAGPFGITLLEEVPVP
ncbi:hypothetical protein BS78_02G298100 [Paspalum vaginatum]|nr:hypothetical protein BS78_02G298100 [Paspalum vaginatum]